MNRTRAISLTLLAAGAALIVFGVWFILGVGFAAIAAGALLIAADLLVPNR